MDMVEWNIITTSDKCRWIVEIRNFDEEEVLLFECSHYDNPSRACLKSLCPIKIKENK